MYERPFTGEHDMTNETFSDAVRRNHQRLFIIALSYTGSHEDSEDILQNVFLKLWKQESSFDDDEHIDKWLTRVCVNECRNHIKMPMRRNIALDEAKDLYTFDKPRDFDVFNAVMSLPKKERTVIILFYYEDLTVKEISGLVKAKESTIKTRLRRAKQRLKEILGDDWINE